MDLILIILFPLTHDERSFVEKVSSEKKATLEGPLTRGFDKSLFFVRQIEVLHRVSNSRGKLSMGNV